MISAYRARYYRLIFSLAAAYNAAFGLWATLWPRSFFDCFEIAPPNYPALWRCLGMVVGLYGILYGYSAWRLDRARPIILVGLAGKILGPIGWLMVVNSGEWPLRTFPLIVFNDLVWWLPFALFLLDERRVGGWVRRATPWVCATINALAALAMLLLLRDGTEAIPNIAERATYISEHPALWRLGWAVWMTAALSLAGFYAWWGAWIPSKRLAIAAFIIALFGLACDLLAESLFIGWLPGQIERLTPLGSLLSGGAANSFYTIAGLILTLGTPFLRGLLRIWAWTIWLSGIALTVSVVVGSITDITISTAVLMSLLCPWVAVFGWSLSSQA
jgi:hypothetical protein